jgi:hypothetical protein
MLRISLAKWSRSVIRYSFSRWREDERLSKDWFNFFQPREVAGSPRHFICNVALLSLQYKCGDNTKLSDRPSKFNVPTASETGQFLNSKSWTKHTTLCPLIKILLKQKNPQGRFRRGCRGGPIGRPRGLCTLPGSNLSYVGIQPLRFWEPTLISYPSRR